MPMRSRILVALASVLAVVALLGSWVDRQLLDTDQWTETSAALLQEESIRVPLANEISAQLADGSRTREALQEALPPRLQPLAGPAGTLVADAVQRAVQRVLASARVQRAWVTLNRVTHEQLVELVEGGGTVVAGRGVILDLRPLAKQIASAIGIDPSVVDRLPEPRGRIVILDPQQLRALRTTGDVLDTLAWLPGILALALYALAVWLARRQPGGMRRAVLASAIGLALAALLVLVVRRVVGNQVITAITGDGPLLEAARDVWRIATTLLAELAAVLIAVGVLGLAGAWLAGDGRRASALRARVAPVLAGRPDLVYGIAALVYLVLLAWGPLGVMQRPWAIVSFGVLLLGGIAALRAQVKRELADADGPGAPPPQAGGDGDARPSAAG
jgi:hypothetical protein